ncbi:MAG: translation initiation factor IF-3 [Opitutaceae bacterium]|nr:translation initiation factor IF-3 [Opitutaceae bacterium]
MASPYPPRPGNAGKRPFHRRNADPYAHIRRNDRIRCPEIRVISPEGKQIGILPTGRALALARQFNLDLVEISANATPPVCRIMDFGKYIYEEQKRTSHAKATATRIKEIEFTPRIADGDFATKIRHAEEFLDEGSKVKLRVKFRGREMAHTEIGFEIMTKALAELAGMGAPDNQPRLMGKQINVMLTPLPAGKRKRRLAPAPGDKPPPPDGHPAEPAASSDAGE